MNSLSIQNEALMKNVSIHLSGSQPSDLPGGAVKLQESLTGKETAICQGDCVNLADIPAAPVEEESPGKKPRASSTHVPPNAPGLPVPVREEVPVRLSMEGPFPVSSPVSQDGEEPINNALRREARRASCNHLNSIAGRLEKGELVGQDYSREVAGLCASASARTERDPLVRTMAAHILKEYVTGSSLVEHWSYGEGPVAGPSAYLDRLEHMVLYRVDPVCLGESCEIPAFVDSLRKDTQEGAIPEKTLGVVSHFANTLYRRSGQQIDEKLREKEPSAQDLAWAEALGSLVDEWWSRGQIEVIREGKPLRAGTVDMKECLAAERVQVYGSSILLGAPVKKQKLSPEMEACVDALAHDYSKDRKGLAMLTGLYGRDKGAAAKVIARLVDEVSPGLDYSKSTMALATLMQEAGNAPWIKELIKPHVGRLITFPQEAEARDTWRCDPMIWPAQRNTLTQVLALFPEVKGPALVAGSLSSLARTDDYILQRDFHKLFDPLAGDPQLSLGPLFDDLASSDRPFMRANLWKTLSLGLERTAWRPSPEQVDRLAARLYSPPGRENISLFNDSEANRSFAEGLRFFSLLDGKNPGALDDLELPGPDGSLVPFKKALLERVRGDSHGALLYRLDSDSDGAVPELCRLFSSDPLIPGELLDEVAGGLAAAGSLAAMATEAKYAFALLCGMKLREPVASAFNGLVYSQRDRSYDSWDMVTSIKKGLTSWVGQGVKTLESGVYAPRAAADLCRDLLKTINIIGDPQFDPTLFDQADAALGDALASSRGGADYRGLTGDLMKSLKDGCAAAGSLYALSPGVLLDFQLLDSLSMSDEPLGKDLKDLVIPLLHKEKDHSPGGVRSTFAHYVTGEMKANAQRLSEHRLTRSESLAAMQENVTLAPLAGYYDWSAICDRAIPEFFSALKEGMGSSAEPAVAEMGKTILGDINLYKAYSQVAPPDVDEGGIAPYWADFKAILKTVGGEEPPVEESYTKRENDLAGLFSSGDIQEAGGTMSRFDLALDIHCYTLEAVSQGVPREKALAHAMECRSLGMDPRTVPMKGVTDDFAQPSVLELDDDELSIDGISIKINRET